MATQDQGAARQIGGGMGGVCPTWLNAADADRFRDPGGIFLRNRGVAGGMNENAGAAAGVRETSGGPALLPVLLDPGGAQTGEAMPVDRILPGEEFLDRERVAAAGLFERKQPATHGRDHFGFAPNDPTLGSRCG